MRNPAVVGDRANTAAAPRARTGGELVWACLRAQGVETVFGYPGGAVIPLYDALPGSGIRHILTRHEQGAVFAAGGYARAEGGRVGVAIATSGPGATNLITGIADAKMDSVPLVCITGQVRTGLIGTDAFQETDIFGLSLPLTKWSRLVLSADELPQTIAQAFAIARSGRPGPVLIDIPVDVLKAKELTSPPLPPAPLTHLVAAETFPSPRLLELLQASRRPMALVGAGVKLSGAEWAMRRLLDSLAIPTAATLHGLGVVDRAAPYYFGLAGMHGSHPANYGLHECDLMLVFGARLDDRVTGDATRFAPQARIVHFEIDPAQLDRVRPGELAVVGDLADTLPAFLRGLESAPPRLSPHWREWQTRLRELRDAEPDAVTALLPIRFLDMLFAALPADAAIVADVGQHQMWAAQRFFANHPRGFITSGGLGAMGFALPASIGVQMARPRATVVCVSGDGGIQMNIQELATVRRCGAAVKIVVLDNQYLGMVRQWQQLFHDRNYSETDLSDNPDFVAIAAAYGIRGRRLSVQPGDAELPAGTADAIGEFLASPDPELLVFACPPEANVFPMVPSGAALSEMIFENQDEA